MKKVILNNSVQMPIQGLGVFLVDNETTSTAVYTAIKNGYRLIDTAAIYDNEMGVGTGIKKAIEGGLVTREELFITSKVWNNHGNLEKTLQAYRDSLSKLQLDYLDLYLLHWPGNNQFIEPWKALEQIYLENSVRAIGVCNFEVEHLENLLANTEIIPAVNQIELHPKLQQKNMTTFAKKHHIQIQAWAPLMQGGLFNDPTLLNIAEKHNRSTAQIILRWHLQQEVIAIPKSIKEHRMIENKSILDFELDAQDLDLISKLDCEERVGPNPKTYHFEL